MALFTTNPQETLVIAENAATRIPQASCALNGTVNVITDTDIVLYLTQNSLTLPVVTVNGVVVFQSNKPQHGWVVKSRVSAGDSLTLTLAPPVGFAYKSTVTVSVVFEPK